MKIPSLDKVEAVGLIAALALVGYVAYKAWETAGAAKKSVSDTIDKLTSAPARAWNWTTGLFKAAPSDYGPGESPVSINQAPSPGPISVPAGYNGYFYPPGASNAFGGDDHGLGVALAQVNGPDAVTGISVPT